MSQELYVSEFTASFIVSPQLMVALEEEREVLAHIAKKWRSWDPPLPPPPAYKLLREGSGTGVVRSPLPPNHSEPEG